MTKKIRKHERKVIFNFYPIKKLAVLKTISYRESVAFEVFLLPEVIVSQSSVLVPPKKPHHHGTPARLLVPYYSLLLPWFSGPLVP